MDATFQTNDVIVILQEVVEVKSKSYIFGRVLQLPRARVNLIHQEFSDSQDRLLHIIHEFIQSALNPTWRFIINVLRHPLLNYSVLAQKIERKYAGNKSEC